MPVRRISVIAAVLTVRSQKTIVRPTIGNACPPSRCAIARYAA